MTPLASAAPSPRVLVIDRDRNVEERLLRPLREANCAVMHTHSALHATALSGAAPPDLIVMHTCCLEDEGAATWARVPHFLERPTVVVSTGAPTQLHDLPFNVVDWLTEPVRLQRLKERFAPGPQAVGAERYRTRRVVVSCSDRSAAKPLVHFLDASGFEVVLSGRRDAIPAPADAVLLCESPSDRATVRPPGSEAFITCSLTGVGTLGIDLAPEKLLRHLAEVTGFPTVDLQAGEAVAWSFPLELREPGETSTPRAAWGVATTPVAIVARSLTPVRAGAPVLATAYVGSTKVETAGVVCWARRSRHPGNWGVTTFGLQLLGGAPRELLPSHLGPSSWSSKTAGATTGGERAHR